MEDEKTHLNLLQLRPPSSSPSPSSSSFSNHLTLINPPDSDALPILGFFNLPNTSHHLQIPPFPSNQDHLLPTSISPYNHLPSSMGGFGYAVDEAADQISNPEIDKADHLLISSNRGKRRKMNCKEEEKEKSREVVHVRAKRGQATDSHSLAERVRREKINEKIRVLQDLVPGCYKTMGMAVMLDVIINYVRSLQNQIEFLSMKLSTASLYFDFNSPEAEALEALQRANPCYAQEAEGMMREQGFDGAAFATWPPF